MKVCMRDRPGQLRQCPAALTEAVLAQGALYLGAQVIGLFMGNLSMARYLSKTDSRSALFGFVDDVRLLNPDGSFGRLGLFLIINDGGESA